jgi:hypothetical protein
MSIQALAIERREEALAESVVLAVADGSHRGAHPSSQQRFPKAIKVYWGPGSEW